MIYLFLGLICAYLLGAIPSAVWYGRVFHGVDVRDYGSGNAGATNTFRVLGKKPGSIVMTADMLKGFIATSLPIFIALNYYSLCPGDLVLWQIGFGVSAVIGHIFPVFAGFKGGKGVATLLGLVLAMNPFAASVCILVFLFLFITLKFVSVGSMTAGIVYAGLMFLDLFNPENLLSMKIFGVTVSILLIYTHRSNIKRLRDKEENKANLSLRRKKK